MQRPEGAQPPPNIFRVVHPPPGPSETAYSLLQSQHPQAPRTAYGVAPAQQQQPSQLPPPQIQFGNAHQLQGPGTQQAYLIPQPARQAPQQASYTLPQHSHVPSAQPTYSLAHLAQAQPNYIVPNHQHVPQHHQQHPQHQQQAPHQHPQPHFGGASLHAQAPAPQPQYKYLHPAQQPQSAPAPRQPVPAAAHAVPAPAPAEPEPAPAPEPRSAGSDKDFGLILPLARVRRIIKADSEVKAVSMEASYAVARATELLLEAMVERAMVPMDKEDRRTMLYKDISDVVQDWSALGFLKDIVPPRVPASVLIGQLRAQQEQQAQREQAEHAAELERQRAQTAAHDADQAGPSAEPSANGYEDDGFEDEDMADAGGQADY